MLVLTRKTNESILIGDNIKITLVKVSGGSVRIGIDAPKDVKIVRSELIEAIAKLDQSQPSDSFETDDVAAVFANAEDNQERPRRNRVPMATAIGPNDQAVALRRQSATIRKAPLASFVSA